MVWRVRCGQRILGRSGSVNTAGQRPGQVAAGKGLVRAPNMVRCPWERLKGLEAVLKVEVRGARRGGCDGATRFTAMAPIPGDSWDVAKGGSESGPHS